MVKIAHPEFARRMQQACDGNPDVPPVNYGRLGWFVRQFDAKGQSVTQETIRKWFLGETYPRPKAMRVLAQVLKVDEAWLSLGKMAEITEKEARLRNAGADGAVNLLAGIIQMSGGHPAFPEASDARAREEKIDLYAVIRGAQYRFHVTLGILTPKGWQFAINVDALSTVVIGVMWTEAFSFAFVELDREGIETVGARKGEVFNVVLPHDDVNWEWRQIESFAERL